MRVAINNSVVKVRAATNDFFLLLIQLFGLQNVIKWLNCPFKMGQTCRDAVGVQMQTLKDRDSELKHSQ